MNNPLFTVIVTAYNQENYIQNTINSILNQSFNDFEIIVVDDGSTDNTYEQLIKLQIKDNRIRVIQHKRNMSTFMSRLTGIQAADGKYILFLDGDDTFFENALQELFNDVINKEDFDVCEFSYYLENDKRKISPIPFSINCSRIEQFAYKDVVVTFVNKLYKSSILKESFENVPVGYMNMSEDVYQSICVAINTKKYIQKDILVFKYNNSCGITSKNYSLQKNECNFMSIKKVVECITEVLNRNINSELAQNIINNMESKFYDWAKVKIKYQTIDSDILKSYLLLPKYFNQNVIEHDFNLLFEDAEKYRNGYVSLKRIIKRYYHRIKRLFKKI